MPKLLKQYGKTNKQIAEDISCFVYPDIWPAFAHNISEFYNRTKKYGWKTETPIEFYGYYSDYDWVLFCSLFGRMIDLPKGFPMYCIDLKQSLDEKTYDDSYWGSRERISLKERLNVIKSVEDYPKENNNHNALSDAKWNKELYNFLINNQ